jgi:hypothetical protein
MKVKVAKDEVKNGGVETRDLLVAAEDLHRKAMELQADTHRREVEEQETAHRVKLEEQETVHQAALQQQALNCANLVALLETTGREAAAAGHLAGRLAAEVQAGREEVAGLRHLLAIRDMQQQEEETHKKAMMEQQEEAISIGSDGSPVLGLEPGLAETPVALLDVTGGAGRRRGETLEAWRLRLEGGRQGEAPKSGSRMDFGEKKVFFQQRIQEDRGSPLLARRREE